MQIDMVDVRARFAAIAAPYRTLAENTRFQEAAAAAMDSIGRAADLEELRGAYSIDETGMNEAETAASRAGWRFVAEAIVERMQTGR